MKKTYLVECSFRIPVELDQDEDSDPYFQIEDNGCPGTGAVWFSIKKHIEECEAKSICWACALGGENKIVEEKK